MKRVVITGLGAFTPLGKSTKEYWKNLLNGVSGAKKLLALTLQNSKLNLLVRYRNMTL